MNINNIVDTMVKMEVVMIKGLNRLISVLKIKKIILIKKN